MKNNKTNSGFTLLELLVVIGIISLLSTILISNFATVRTKAKIQATRSLIATIQASLEAYYAVYGDYPPTDLSDLYPGTSNGINNGIESVVACLSDQNKGGPFLQGILESKYTNLDGDSCGSPPTNWWFGDTQLREIVDEWNNPLVYFHSRDYDNPSKGSNYSFTMSGDAIAPQKNSATATYYMPLTFQIWSAGPDEKNNNGLGNDINNWNK
jgi:prepilin-type N-terminal cleavage/methylation domain-containing protein